MYEIDKEEFAITIRIAETLIESLQEQIKDLRAGTHIEQLMSYNYITYLADQKNVFNRVHNKCTLTGMEIMRPEHDNELLAKSWRKDAVHPMFKSPEDKHHTVLRQITGEDFPEKPPIDNQTTH